MTDAERKNLFIGEGPRGKLEPEEGERLSKLIKAEIAVEIEKLKSEGSLSTGDVPGEMWALMPSGGLKL